MNSMMARNKSTLHCSKSNNSSTVRLFYSIHVNEDVVSIQDLLQEGADIDATDSKGYTPLLRACFHGRKEIVVLLMHSGANVDVCNNEYTVLHYASRRGWTDVVQFLLRKGEDVKGVRDINARDVHWETALHKASRGGHLETVKCLVETGADLDAVDVRGETAMHLASRSGHLEVVECLVEVGADKYRKNEVGYTPLLCAADYCNIDVVNLLLISMANVDGDERILLYFASLYGWTKMVECLVKRIPDLNQRHAIDETDSEEHSSRRHLELVKCFVQEGTDINARNEKIALAALHYASVEGYLEVVKYLVEKGTDINASDYHGDTALLRASLRDHLEVKYLVDKGADINARNIHGDTALHNASRNGQLEVVKFLLEEGADINEKNFNGETPLLCATRCECTDVVDWLIYCGANVNVSDQDETTVLHFAAMHGWIDTIKSLVKRGCDLDARDVCGVTALSEACCFHRFDTVEYLLQAGANWDIADKIGKSPLNNKDSNLEFEYFKLFIENGAYLRPVDYDAIVKNIPLKVNILQDVNLCSQAIVNKFNNYDLPNLYKLPASRNLPPIEKMKIVCGSEMARAIEQTVGFEIQTKGHCNVLEVCPIVLSILSVGAVLECNEKEIV